MMTAKEFTREKNRLIFASITILLVLISWIGILDYLSYAYLAESLQSALSSYGLSRTLNGIISVLQTSTLSIGVASVSVGELLDPINDIIERFSELLTLSIASLIVQKVLLGIVSSNFFKVLFTFSGLCLLTSLTMRELPYIQVLTRSFIFLVFLRLALSLMILLNSAVDNSFLASQINDNFKNINVETEQLDSLKNKIIKQNEAVQKLENTIAESKKQKLILVENLGSQIDKKHELENKISSKQIDIEQIKSKLSIFEKFNFLREDEILYIAEKDLEEMEQLLERTEESIDVIKSATEDIDEQINYYENEITGNSGGLIKGIKEMAGFIKNNNISNVNAKLAEVKQKLDFIVNNLLDLMTLFIMKTVLLPILFMYLLTKLFKLIWVMELRYFKKVQQ